MLCRRQYWQKIKFLSSKAIWRIIYSTRIEVATQQPLVFLRILSDATQSFKRWGRSLFVVLPCIMRIKFFWFHELNFKGTCNSKLIVSESLSACVCAFTIICHFKHYFSLETCYLKKKRSDKSFLNLTFLCEPVSVCCWCACSVCVAAEALCELFPS